MQNGKRNSNGCLLLIVIIMAFLLFPVIMHIGGCDGTAGNRASTSSSNSATPADSAMTSDCKLKITDTKITEPYSPIESKELGILLSWENRSGKETSFNMEIGCEAIQDGIVLSGSPWTAEKKYKERNDNSTKTVVNGKKLKVGYFFELEDTKHPVKVTFTDRHTDKVILEKTIKL